MAESYARTSFDPIAVRGAMRDEFARTHFDIGRERSERRIAAVLAKEGCDCDRCTSNQEHRERFDPRALFTGKTKTSKPRPMMQF